MISATSIKNSRLCCPSILVFVGVLLFGVSQTQASSSAMDHLGPRSTDTLDYQNLYGGDEDEEGDARFLFSSTTGVPVNSTLIRVVGAIIGALLIGLPLFLAYTTALNSNNNGGGGGYGSHYRRFKREEQDEMASLIYAIMESFKKYEVDEIGCQIQLACESAQYQKGQKHSQYQGLPARIHKLLSTMTLFDLDPEEFLLHDYVLDLLKAHELGLHSGQSICDNTYGSRCNRS
ncbi:hypothetical protein TCAL_05154 [Tigriopus californicus]|uniref:Uncharacterized protein n=1 Tax=Tigriopus californicus TaxID=6832 RepID=A0A553NNR8_TIGCA|nr:uncharacterized protein LOC131878865 [Tigriopus californicus]TRY67092.1 hypothetical protein TCAL_05154 [Tigriopus californicus]|eukprot:TCALIF_05154-PA protein Name:"Protein of unknown function" AED:0.00 eAED:0.00 QI:304/1/1/1/1/1/3/280/232